MLLSSCGRDALKEKEIATVNDAPVLLKDFKREVSLAKMRDPSLKINPQTLEDQLETLLEKKLMVQYAIKKGLSEDEHFLDTIKTFWEQTLVRQLIDAKTREWSERLAVTDEEARKHFERMGQRVTFRIISTKTEEEAKGAMERVLRGEIPEGAKEAGPFLIENIQFNNPLHDAFDLNAGEAKALKSDSGYSVIQVVKKEAYKTAPLEEVYGEIKQALLEQKKQKALEEWVHELKRSARIEIKQDELKKVLDGQK